MNASYDFSFRNEFDAPWLKQFLSYAQVGSFPKEFVFASVYEDIDKLVSEVPGTVIFYDFFHFHEDMLDLLLARLQKRKSNFHVVSALVHPAAVKHDALWNRQKAYYKNVHDDSFKGWYFCGNKAYVVPTEVNTNHGSKIFLSPNRIYTGSVRGQYRRKLVNIANQLKHLGHVSEICIEDERSQESTIIQSLPSQNPDAHGYGFNPIHQDVYDDSFISVFVETMVYGISAPTEKSYTPLIKGHFILPFGSRFLIRQLSKDGWKFPRFIDYGYDNIIDTDERWAAFENEFRRLMNFPVSYWHEQRQINRDILHHNMMMLHNKPFDTLTHFKKLITNEDVHSDQGERSG